MTKLNKDTAKTQCDSLEEGQSVQQNRCKLETECKVFVFIKVSNKSEHSDNEFHYPGELLPVANLLQKQRNKLASY